MQGFSYLIWLINAGVQLLSLLVIVYTLTSYFMSPYHPVRQMLGRLVEPMLSPLRRVIPPVGMMDFTPLVLIILLEVVGTILTSVLRSFS